MIKMKKQDEELIAQHPWLLDVSGPLLAWYDRQARILPWREQNTPYRVWVSEIMLQQTRVEAALPYFERFMQALPTIKDLADADPQLLLKLWEGLGYYNRVRNLQAAARAVVEKWDGNLPDQYDQLVSLPGIGDYTAGAIASIAYNRPIPAVDGNVLRVLSRLLASRADVTQPSVKKEMRSLAQAMIPSERAGDFNQALMELGAIVCLPNGAPRCDQCPVYHLCRGSQQGIAHELPVKPPKKQRRSIDLTVFILICEGNVLLRQRPKKGLLAGLWEFPHVEGWITAEEASRWVNQWGGKVLDNHALPKAQHIFSHLEWHMTAYKMLCTSFPAPKGYIWADRSQLSGQIALPSAFRAYSKHLPEWL
ncbi:putative A/G-specific adenine glycosylase YfhQ [Eubacteriaceae bacterium CHKCI005]|nr:putative A/G-specific adenine glycosylase YfhQ [Eubacteriaceae bacterium CHKCI005]